MIISIFQIFFHKLLIRKIKVSLEGARTVSGIFGTHAALITDLNFIMQIISFLLLLAGFRYKLKKKFKIHGFFMSYALFFHLIFFVIAMWPSFSAGFNFYINSTSMLGVQAMWIHAIPGLIVLVLGLYIVMAWFLRISNIAACFKRKRLMDIVITLWLISIIFGIVTYLDFYL